MSADARRGARIVAAAVTTVAIVAAAWLWFARSVPESKTMWLGYRLTATSDDGTPLPGVALSSGARELAVTDEQGVAHVQLRGRIGASAPLRVRCPDGYRGAPAVAPVVFRPLREVTSGAAPQRLDASVSCDRGVRRVAIVVRTLVETTTVRRSRGRRIVDAVERTPGAATVLVDGAAVGETDEHGLFQVALLRPPATLVELAIEPRGPDGARLPRQVLPVEVSAHDDVYVFDRVVPREIAAVPRARRPRKPAPQRPSAPPPIRAVEKRSAPFEDL